MQSAHAPATINRILGMVYSSIPNHIIWGSTYRNAARQLRHDTYASATTLFYRSFDTLRSIVSTCYSHSPFYSSYYQRHGFHPDDLKQPSDVKKIPFIDKEIIRSHISDVCPARRPGVILSSTTSGTTSTPFAFPESLRSKILERAFIDHFYAMHGVSDTARKITLKGSNTGTNHWYFNPLLKSTVFRFAYLDEASIAAALGVIDIIRPCVIGVSYPSIIYAFAKYINSDRTLDFSYISKVFCSSETLMEYQARAIAAAFGTRPINYYGQNERVAQIIECPAGSLHVVPEYGFTEFIASDHFKEGGSGEYSEIVSTGFLNMAFPLIRYRTGDFAVVSDHSECSCGLPHQLVEQLVGRRGDVIQTPDGRRISPAMIEFVTENYSNIDDYQFIQEKLDELIVNIKLSDATSPFDEQSLLEDLRAVLGNGLHYSLRIVPALERTAAGKKQIIVNRVDQGDRV